MTAPHIATPLVATTQLSISMTQQEYNDAFDDIIRTGLPDNDNHSRGEEGCYFPIGECDQTAKYWLCIASNQEKDGQYQFYFCPRHFALRLHLILDAIRRNKYFDEQQTPAQVREVLQSYFLSWGANRLLADEQYGFLYAMLYAAIT